MGGDAMDDDFEDSDDEGKNQNLPFKQINFYVTWAFILKLLKYGSFCTMLMLLYPNIILVVYAE